MFKKALPYIVAFLLFIILPALYFAPQYEGKDIRKFDSVQANGMTSPILDHIEKYGEHPFWSANMFGGMPSYPMHLERTPDLIKSASNCLYFLGSPASYYFMLMAGFFIMLICFGVNPWLGTIGAIAYGFSTYFIIIFEAGHIMKIIALCYVAPLIGTLYYTYRKSFWIGAPLFGVFTLLEINSVHPQITYYFIITMVIMVICLGIIAYKEKTVANFIRNSIALLITSMLAIGANISYLYYTYDYSKDSIRGKAILTDNTKVQNEGGLDKDYITAWSYGKMETFNLFIPNLTGGKSNGGFSPDGEVAKTLQKYTNKREAESITSQLPGYWGPQPMTSGPVYIGAVMIFLFVLGLFLIRGANLWWIVGATSLAIILAWGKHFMGITDLFIDYFPMYDKFRTVSMILVVAELTIPLMAMLVLASIWNNELPYEKVKKALLNSIYITGGIAIFFILFGGMLFSFISSSDGGLGLPEEIITAMQHERISMMRADSLRSLIFVAITFGLIWFFIKKKLNKKLFVTLLIAIVIADMVPVALRHVNHSMFNQSESVANSSPMTDADRQILQDTDINYRVVNLGVSTFNDATTSIYHRSVGGYFAAKPRRYQDIIDRHLTKMNMSVYNMLNTKYMIVPDEKIGQTVKVNADAYGNAWIVDGINFVSTPNEEIDALNSVDLKTKAVVSNEFKDIANKANFETDSSDVITHTQYKANRMVYKTSLSKDRLVVFSEIYYPKGWTAYIDGVETPYFRANYILNAMVIPSGDHEIVFEFMPPHYSTIKIIATGSSILLIVLLAIGLIITVRKRKKTDK